MSDGPSIVDRLADHLRAGTRLDLLPDVAPDEHGLRDADEMAGWGPEHCVPADVVRQLLLGRIVADPDPRGLRLRGARIEGVLDLEQLVTDVSLELADCLIEDGIRAHDARLRGLWLHRCRVNSATGPAFGGCRLKVGTLVSFAYSAMTANSGHGALQLLGARVDGELSLSSASLINTGGAALAADGLQTAGDLFLNEGFTARAVGDHAVGLTGAVIGGVLDCSDSHLFNPDGAALSADRLSTLAAVRLDRLSAVGALRLSDTRFGGRLACQAASVSDSHGPALILERAQINGRLYLNRGFAAEGLGDGGAVRLVSAHVTGGVTCRNATLRNPTGPALVADGLRVDGDILLDNEFVADGHGPRCTVRLRDVRVSGKIACTGAAVGSRSDPAHRWDVDGLTYRGMPQIDAAGHHRKGWLRLVRDATPDYRAQPYQQLAAVCRADGHDSEARTVLMQQRRDQLDRGALTHRADRLWARLTGALLGFGYQPWRALLYLVGVLALSVGLAWLGAMGGALDRVDDRARTATATAAGNAPRVPCTTTQVIGLGLDLGTPFLPSASTGAGGCAITSAASGSLLTGARWLLQLTAWGLAALFVAGFTGIVRKT